VRTLPVLEGALAMLTGEGGASAPDHSLDQLQPADAFLSVQGLVASRRPDDPPLPRGEHETVQQAAMRVQAQAHTASLILPKPQAEGDEQFKLRLACFKPRQTRGKAGVKPPLAIFVLPMAEGEKPKDFEARMKMQEGTPFVILPRDALESVHDYKARLDSIGEARTLWLDHEKVPPPLLLPRGQHEAQRVFTERLETASTPPELTRKGKYKDFCPVFLPQAKGEPDDVALERIAAQASTKSSVLPFDPAIESLGEFQARLPASP